MNTYLYKFYAALFAAIITTASAGYGLYYMVSDNFQAKLTFNEEHNISLLGELDACKIVAKIYLPRDLKYIEKLHDLFLDRLVLDSVHLAEEKYVDLYNQAHQFGKNKIAMKTLEGAIVYCAATARNVRNAEGNKI